MFMTPSAAPPVSPAGSIVVGIDGSAASDQALDWATQQATLEHRPLTIVHSVHLGMAGGTLWMGQPGFDVGGLLEDVRIAGKGLLDNAERRAHRHAPALAVHTILSNVDTREALLNLAERAALVVVGSRGRGPVASLLLGSVSVAVSTHAACPVVVIRHPKGTGPRDGVLVDVDGTEESLPAIEFAYRTASFRSLPLTALHVVWDHALRGDDEHLVDDDDPGLDDERMLLSESIAGMREKFPDVQDRLVLVRGLRDHQLVRASQDMDLVVVGSRQRGLIDDFVYGSVAPTVVEHAACDVAVVPSIRPVS